MKVLIIKNESSFKDSIKSILESYIDGIMKAGGIVETISIDSLNIKPCKECTKDYFFQSNCSCQIEDDMTEIYPKLKEYNNWVFATDFKDNLFNTNMKNLLDRLEPLFQFDDMLLLDVAANTERKSTGKISLFATSNEWDVSSFEVLTRHFQTISDLYNKDFAGALLRPHASALDTLDDSKETIENLSLSAREAGLQFVYEGNISYDIRNNISKVLVARDSFIHEIGRIFR